jgi:phage replication-related protein YjqB (UPF0714/DUF867 family)
MLDIYTSYAQLAREHREGVDFDRIVLPRAGSKIAVIAPHGGRLENHTDTIAEAVAGSEFSFYCFRSKLGRQSPNLHITSHNFDDPECVSLVAAHRWAVAIHGCAAAGERIFLGGRDELLVQDLARSLAHAGIRAEASGHPYPGKHPKNIVNRSASGMGVQIELSMQVRTSEAVPLLVTTLRTVLLERQCAV